MKQPARGGEPQAGEAVRFHRLATRAPRRMRLRGRDLTMKASSAAAFCEPSPERRRWSAGWIRRWLVAATFLLVVPAGLTFYVSERRATDLLEHSHYNDVFDAGQAEAALLRLDAELGRFVADPGPEAGETVRLRYDLLLNHIDVLSHGQVGLAIDAVAPGLTLRLEDTLTHEGPLVARLASVEDARRVLASLTPLECALAQAASLVSAQSAASITGTGQALRSTRNILLVLTLGLLATTLSLAVVLWRRHAEVRHLAYRDTLTGLANRFAFNAALDAECGRGGLAVLLVDLDHFKEVNDAFGHDVGNALLQQMASRLVGVIPEAHVVARLGGDEFAVLLRAPGTASGVSDMAERICAAAAEPIQIGDLQVRSRLSIGVLVDAARDQHPVGLLKRADLALYAAKAAGRGRFQLFNPGLEQAFHARREMEADLRDAVAADAMTVHFQPIADLATGRPVICEALARWNHPVRGRVPPSDFIPIAESSALIVALGQRVLARACIEAGTWPRHVRVAVNVSSQQILAPDFVEQVTAILVDTGLAAERLEMEITESVLLRTDEGVLGTIQRLRRLGVTFALDDFGTGYSSLGRLHRLPIDKIKIDQSFTRSMPDSNDALGIVESIIDLARKLGLTTTAEGIETEAQHDLLCRAGCGQGQGYLYARPLSSEDCRRTLNDPRWDSGRLHRSAAFPAEMELV